MLVHAACSSVPSIASLADDEMRLTISHLLEDDLSALACTCRKMLVLASSERDRRRQEMLKEREIERRKMRAAREHFAQYESDARVLATVIRYMLINAPAEHSFVQKRDRMKLVAPSSGVCRLRVGIWRGQRGVASDQEHAEQLVDALAMQKHAVRDILFMGEPLGVAGSAVAVRQARSLQLAEPEDTVLHGKAFRLLIRGDVIRDFLASSPTLAKAVVGEDEVME